MKWIHARYEFYVCVDDSDYDKVSQYLWRTRGREYAQAHELSDIAMHELILGKQNNGLVIDHINRAPWDNRKQNLRIVTQSDNRENYGIPDNPPFPSEKEKEDAKKHRIELVKSRNNYSKAAKKNKNWLSCRKRVINDKGQIFDSIKEAAICIGYPGAERNISACCRGLRKRCRGFEWKFYNE